MDEQTDTNTKPISRNPNNLLFLNQQPLPKLSESSKVTFYKRNEVQKQNVEESNPNRRAELKAKLLAKIARMKESQEEKNPVEKRIRK